MDSQNPSMIMANEECIALPISILLQEKLNNMKFYDSKIHDLVIVPLDCPITRRRIRFPARGFTCSHKSVFDLEGFLHEKYWSCPICDKELKYTDIFIDQTIYHVLITIAHEEKGSQIMLKPDGNHEMIQMSSNSNDSEYTIKLNKSYFVMPNEDLRDDRSTISHTSHLSGVSHMQNHPYQTAYHKRSISPHNISDRSMFDQRSVTSVASGYQAPFNGNQSTAYDNGFNRMRSRYDSQSNLDFNAENVGTPSSSSGGGWNHRGKSKSQSNFPSYIVNDNSSMKLSPRDYFDNLNSMSIQTLQHQSSNPQLNQPQSHHQRNQTYSYNTGNHLIMNSNASANRSPRESGENSSNAGFHLKNSGQFSNSEDSVATKLMSPELVRDCKPIASSIRQSDIQRQTYETPNPQYSSRRHSPDVSQIRDEDLAQRKGSKGSNKGRGGFESQEIETAGGASESTVAKEQQLLESDDGETPGRPEDSGSIECSLVRVSSTVQSSKVQSPQKVQKVSEGDQKMAEPSSLTSLHSLQNRASEGQNGVIPEESSLNDLYESRNRASNSSADFPHNYKSPQSKNRYAAMDAASSGGSGGEKQGHAYTCPDAESGSTVPTDMSGYGYGENGRDANPQVTHVTPTGNVARKDLQLNLSNMSNYTNKNSTPQSRAKRLEMSFLDRQSSIITPENRVIAERSPHSGVFNFQRNATGQSVSTLSSRLEGDHSERQNQNQRSEMANRQMYGSREVSEVSDESAHTNKLPTPHIGSHVKRFDFSIKTTTAASGRKNENLMEKLMQKEEDEGSRSVIVEDLESSRKSFDFKKIPSLAGGQNRYSAASNSSSGNPLNSNLGRDKDGSSSEANKGDWAPLSSRIDKMEESQYYQNDPFDLSIEDILHGRDSASISRDSGYNRPESSRSFARPYGVHSEVLEESEVSLPSQGDRTLKGRHSREDYELPLMRPQFENTVGEEEIQIDPDKIDCNLDENNEFHQRRVKILQECEKADYDKLVENIEKIIEMDDQLDIDTDQTLVKHQIEALDIFHERVLNRAHFVFDRKTMSVLTLGMKNLNAKIRKHSIELMGEVFSNSSDDHVDPTMIQKTILHVLWGEQNLNVKEEMLKAVKKLFESRMDNTRLKKEFISNGGPDLLFKYISQPDSRIIKYAIKIIYLCGAFAGEARFDWKPSERAINDSVVDRLVVFSMDENNVELQQPSIRIINEFRNEMIPFLNPDRKDDLKSRISFLEKQKPLKYSYLEEMTMIQHLLQVLENRGDSRYIHWSEISRGSGNK